MKFKKYILIIISFLLLIFNTHTVYGTYTFTLSASKSEVSPKENFTVSVSVPGSGMFYASATNGEVSPSSQYCDTTCTFNATAGNSGSTTITITAGEAGTSNEVTAFEDDSNISGSKSKTITIKSSSSSGSNEETTTPTTPIVVKSSDNSLKSLTISEGKLTPEFSPSITEYTLDLEATVTKININAISNHANASVKGVGDIDVSVGKNVIKITCTAENGNPKVYKINAIVDETPLVFVEYNDIELGVVRNLNTVPELDGFEEITVKLNEQEINAWYSQTRNVTVLYLQNEDQKDFYIYDEINGILSKYLPISIDGKELVFTNIPSDLHNKTGLTYQELTINDYKIMGWVFNNEAFKNYSLIYVMDEDGKYNYYQYETTQDTLQLYSNAVIMTQEELENTLNQKDEQLKNMKMYLYIMIGICILIFIGLIYALINMNRYKKRLLVKTNKENKVD